MDYLKYVDSSSFLHKLDPRTKFAFFVAMAVLTSVIKSFVALTFLLLFFIGMWKSCHIGKQILTLLSKLKILLLFIFLLWSILVCSLSPRWMEALYSSRPHSAGWESSIYSASTGMTYIKGQYILCVYS